MQTSMVTNRVVKLVGIVAIALGIGLGLGGGRESAAVGMPSGALRGPSVKVERPAPVAKSAFASWHGGGAALANRR